MIRRALATAAVGLLCLPASASGHALVTGTTPAQGADLGSAPRSVAFYFTEPVEASFGAVRAFNARGDEVQEGDLTRPGGRSDAVGVRLPSDLPDGTYTATYHVVSADSHPVSGGFVFTVGDPGSGSRQTVAELIDQGSAGRVTDVAFVIDRFAGYAAIGVALGAILFLFVAFGPAAARSRPFELAAFERRFSRLIGAAIATGLLASLLAIPLQGANAGGTAFAEAIDPQRIEDVMETRFGEVMSIRAIAWAALGAALFAAIRVGAGLTGRPPSRASAASLAVPLGVLALTPALSGHARTLDPTAVLFPADVVHVVGMGVWLGGLLALVVAVPAATAALEKADRGRLLGAVLGRFSAMALAAVIALAITGAVQAVIEVGSFEAMVDTGFGRAVSAKIALFLGLVTLGWANRRRLIPALGRLAEKGASPGRVGVALRRNLRLEIGLIAVVLAVTAVLVGYAPPGESAGGPISGRVELGEQLLEYTVDPAEVGDNEVHLYLFNAADGSQFDGAREVTASATQTEEEIGPLDLDLRKAGPGHYLAPRAPLGVSGDWKVTVEVRTSRFEQTQAELDVEIR